jgi:predicted short-subunit dehydrogenase-like oxidoreductase (DUF2520 family)
MPDLDVHSISFHVAVLRHRHVNAVFQEADAVNPLSTAVVHASVEHARALGGGRLFPPATVMVPDLLEPTEEIRDLCLDVVTTLHEVRDSLGFVRYARNPCFSAY